VKQGRQWFGKLTNRAEEYGKNLCTGQKMRIGVARVHRKRVSYTIN
jgi:ABC-type methionine transport system ATPase subunit